MTRKSFSRSVKLTVASIMAVLFGFPGIAVANQAAISNTGPDSYNKIELENSDKCEVENNNDVNVKNLNFQNAHTGDAVVGSQWGAYAPEAWQAKGYSYEQWHAAVSAHMAEYEGKWGGLGGGGNTTGGDATSGDATNVNNTSTGVNIDNSGACAEFIMVDTNGDAKPDKKVVKKPGQVLGSTSSSLGMSGGGSDSSGSPSRSAGGSVLGASSTGAGGAFGVGGQGGAGGAFSPTTSGGAGGDGAGAGGGGAGGNQYSISNTGPDSLNKIYDTSNNNVNIENNNNVSVVNYSKQYASSGNATVSGNTTGGAAGSGGAANSSGTTSGTGINN